ncbi:MAG TPA: hypothetical protein VGU71_14870 [Candidatus Dormibacteraeota bacterium]|nr:hypothetical protein [Candidatus Dormibacteraeota bacterium]
MNVKEVADSLGGGRNKVYDLLYKGEIYSLAHRMHQAGSCQPLRLRQSSRPTSAPDEKTPSDLQLTYKARSSADPEGSGTTP